MVDISFPEFEFHLFPLNRKKRQIFPTELNLIPITYLDKNWFLA